MLTEFLKNNVGDRLAPFVAVAIFVAVVGVALWLTPRVSKWIDKRRMETPDFYHGMHTEPPEDTAEE